MKVLPTAIACSPAPLTVPWVATGLARLPSIRPCVTWVPVGELDDELRQPVRAADEVAVGVGGQQRHVADVGVGDLDAEELAALAFRSPQVAMVTRVVGGAHDAVAPGA